ncbi:hypothetical protein CMV_023148 [Castanea mollissima]|uniref:Uncharacterized protein n=1 Tax=Castanea mollissima TaxID=60419 RepID=A0A8J4VAX7_9ROSI|nr:hypothetical protein CMV_023148 [Castanea mollissima]
MLQATLYKYFELWVAPPPNNVPQPLLLSTISSQPSPSPLLSLFTVSAASSLGLCVGWEMKILRIGSNRCKTQNKVF